MQIQIATGKSSTSSEKFDSTSEERNVMVTFISSSFETQVSRLGFFISAF